MRQNAIVALLAGSANLAAAADALRATPTSAAYAATGTTATATAPQFVEPCAKASSSWAAQLQATDFPKIDAAVAFDCLNSVPLNRSAAIELVDAIEPYLEWQTDSKYKANPPKDYPYPAYDMFANLAKIKRKLENHIYPNEYEFQLELFISVFNKGHDGHFILYPDLLTKVFGWARPRSLVSISEDGRSLPAIKLYEDVLSSPKTASVVKLINGIDAAKYLEDTINIATWNHEPDGAYNSMFFQKSSVADDGTATSTGYFARGGRINHIYHGPQTTLTFENGTVLKFDNQALVLSNMTGVVDGPSFYSTFCLPAPLPPDDNDPPPLSNNSLVLGYPKPVIATKDGIVSGYYLTGEGLEDVAVIVLLAFESEDIAEFQAVCQDFFREATAAGKTKLVIDLQANGGGFILQGYDLFRQLFPHVVQDGFGRFIDSKAFVDIAHILSDEVAGKDPNTSNDPDLIDDYLSPFNFRYDLNLTDENFLTFKEKFGPFTFKDAPFTNIVRWNLSDPLTTTNATFGLGIEISGYGTLANISQPFKAEDIILVYDGACASTCTIASEMLRIQAGVKSIMFGGRPFRGPAQAVGGIKGSQVLDFSDIYQSVQRAFNITNDPQKKKELARYTELPMQRSLASAVNARDQILRSNLHDGLPAQYVVENSDCRLFWTLPMINDVSEVWKAAANSAFNGAKCAYGGIRQPSKRSVDSRTPYVPMKPQQRRSELINQRPRTRQTRSRAWRARHLQKARGD